MEAKPLSAVNRFTSGFFSVGIPEKPSFPSSAWERSSAKLRFASRPVPEPDAKQSFAPVRSQAELGNEGSGDSDRAERFLRRRPRPPFSWNRAARTDTLELIAPPRRTPHDGPSPLDRRGLPPRRVAVAGDPRRAADRPRQGAANRSLRRRAARRRRGADGDRALPSWQRRGVCRLLAGRENHSILRQRRYGSVVGRGGGPGAPPLESPRDPGLRRPVAGSAGAGGQGGGRHRAVGRGVRERSCGGWKSRTGV